MTRLALLFLPLLLLGCGLPDHLVEQLKADRADFRAIADDQGAPGLARQVAQAAADECSVILFETGEEETLGADARARREARRAR